MVSLAECVNKGTMNPLFAAALVGPFGRVVRLTFTKIYYINNARGTELFLQIDNRWRDGGDAST